MTRPIFILSLPRSGSTLLQRMLTASESVSSAAEPWMLLPFIYALKSEGQFSEYWHVRSVEAMSDFLASFEHGEQVYFQELNHFATRLYSKASGDQSSIYFLDKTPRYHLIVEELLQVFPDAKFILLWRNPLAVAASIIETWGGGKWKLHAYKIDLYRGLANLVSCYKSNSSRIHVVKYEDLLTEPEHSMQSICRYLDIEYEAEMLSTFHKVSFSGSMGDPTGVVDYTQLSDKPLHKWKQTMANPIRRFWCKSYLKWLGEDRLRIMKYNKSVLINELAESPLELRTVFKDLILGAYGLFYALFEPAFIRYKTKKLKNWKDSVSHR